VISSSQGLYLNAGQHKHRINTYTYQTSMYCVGFLPSIPGFKRAKSVNALDRSATVTGDDVNLLGDNIDTIKWNTQTLIDVSKEVALEVNTEKTKYMLVSSPEYRAKLWHKNM
jgi:hypothetical protein